MAEGAFKQEFFGTVFEKFAKKYVSKNAWRVRRYWDYEDCMQEAYVVFARVVNKYPNVDNPRWLMGIYSLALVNEFNSQALITRGRYEAEEDFAQNKIYYDGDVDHNIGAISSLLSDASDELKTVLKVIINAPRELIGIMLNSEDACGDAYSDEAWSRKLCRLSGIKHTKDGIVSELRNMLKE